MSADKLLKYYTPVRGIVVILIAMGVWIGKMEVRADNADDTAKKVEQVQTTVVEVKEDVAEIKGQLKILVDIATKKAASGTTQ